MQRNSRLADKTIVFSEHEVSKVVVMVTRKASTCQEISWQKEILDSGRKNAWKSFLEGN
jgi:hypothetical protein